MRTATPATPAPTWSIYDYPGNYTDRDDGERLAKIRLEAQQALDNRRHAAGDASSLYPGGLFKLVRPPEGRGERRVPRRPRVPFLRRGRATGPAHDEEAGETYFGNYELLPSDRRSAPRC